MAASSHTACELCNPVLSLTSVELASFVSLDVTEALGQGNDAGRKFTSSTNLVEASNGQLEIMGRNSGNGEVHARVEQPAFKDY